MLLLLKNYRPDWWRDVWAISKADYRDRAVDFAATASQ
jgi:hypothetical protein